MRDFRRGRDTAHRYAFEIFLCRLGWAILRIENRVDKYLEALAEAGKER